jgi:hypothetical protein
MLSFITAMSLANLLGGRWGDIVGEDKKGGGRIIFRAVLPAILAASLMGSISAGIVAGGIVLLGSLLWATPGWSFDEINGEYDNEKYPKFIRYVGYSLFPPDAYKATNRKRGIIMKGMRGGYDIPMFIALGLLNPVAFLFAPVTLLMGAVFWACGRVVEERLAVLSGEIAWGAMRGVLIYVALGV